MIANYKAPFRSFLKKQSLPLRIAIEDVVEDICNDPQIGERKTGDLAGFRVLKFTFRRQQYLIAYRPPEPDMRKKTGFDIEFLVIDFYQAGTHENFYEALKHYLKS
ncbi:type II toxin-antitoxin system RelE/ParE family toxin [Paraburkholderia sp.]|uniref:type II toxin-antitoxin system RelE/ParE family toxin n=1 Tax=Paraburkholderia sp. TaxID=1926495 RepID=UPI002382EB32|nr:type II toxin-antitoxin system RelE/ParE family toxin [Paraburkholderia sp.]MDE1179898.1 type II toxin-antitoxin system RelE/ParE family toxin [Paraburkholderia sp.]